MTKQELEEIKARVDKASPGPWEATRKDYSHNGSDAFDWAIKGCWFRRTSTIGDRLDENSSQAKHDRDFIASARTDIPKLIKWVEELQTCLELANKRAEINQDLIDGAMAHADKIRELYKQNQELRENALKAANKCDELLARLKGTE
jgi:hypothetical protein